MLTPQEKIYILEKLREMARKISDLDMQIKNLTCYIADDDELVSNDTQ